MNSSTKDEEFKEKQSTDQSQSHGIYDSIVVNHIDEAIMNDNVNQFKNLCLTENQICDFVYQVTGPKTISSSQSQAISIRNKIGESEIFQLNYNIVMLACPYGSIKILEYLYEKVVLKSKDPQKTK